MVDINMIVRSGNCGWAKLWACVDGKLLCYVEFRDNNQSRQALQAKLASAKPGTHLGNAIVRLAAKRDEILAALALREQAELAKAIGEAGPAPRVSIRI